MRQIAWQLTLLGGLLLVTGVACTDRSTARAPRSTAVAEIEATPVQLEEPLTYTVVAGDFLSAIAARFDVSLDELTEANGIQNAAIIEVGQVLVIPGQQTVVTDPFFAATPAEPWPEVYPPPALPPPPELSPLDELRNRIAAWPWPERPKMVGGIVVGGFALAALVAGLMLTSLEYNTRRWAVRAVPRGARRTFKLWGDVAVKPRHAYLAVRRRAIAGWNLAARAVRAVDHRYRWIRTTAVAGWVRTKPQRERFMEWARPALIRLDDIAGRAVDAGLERAREIADTVRERAPATTDSFSSLGGRASTSLRRTVKTGAERARRDVFEAAPPPERWRSRIAGELARAFERGQLEVRYVPVIDLDARTLTAIEAHLFWQHPQRGLMAARDIHSATHEHPELGAALLEFLLEQSCQFLKDEVDGRYPSAQLIVPITLEQIVESEPLAAIDRGLTTANLALDRLKVSIAEPHALHDTQTASTFIRNLRSMGIGVHLDDYGIAQTAELQQLGVSSVTVDFAAIGSSNEARDILSDAVEIAQDLRLPVTARHARSEAAQALQVSLGCAYEAVGEPLPTKTFVSTHVEERPTPVAPPVAETAPTQLHAAATTEDGESSEGSESSEPADTTDETTLDRQTHRPAGPLRLTRPATAYDEADTATAESEIDGDRHSISAIDATEDTETDADEEADASSDEVDNSDAGRPVDAA